MKKHKLISVIMFFVIILTACTPAENTPTVNMTEIQSTAIVIVQTRVVLTQASLPTVTQDATPAITPLTPSPYPTQTPYILKITPDANQVERWREYQTALAHSMLHEEYAKYALCEWEILGQNEQEIYVWATCTSGIQASRAAVIYLQADGSIQEVKAPFSVWDSEVQELFPENVRKIIHSYGQITGPQEMLDRLKWRHSHWEEPPLIVLTRISTATPIP